MEKWAEVKKKIIEKAWRDDQFKQEFIANPKKMIEQEAGITLQDNITVKVVEDTADTVYFKLPLNPEQLSDEALDKISGGVPAFVKAPAPLPVD